MKNKAPNYITPAGLSRLREEYAQLHSVERPQVVETVAWAAGNGDRSENGDYIYGKRRLREIDRRMRFLSQRIEDAHVVNPAEIKSTHVVFGATVTVEDENGEERSFTIIGEDEVDTSNGRISWKSPVAQALLGKKVGDAAIIRRPSGDLEVEILTIAYR